MLFLLPLNTDSKPAKPAKRPGRGDEGIPPGNSGSHFLSNWLIKKERKKICGATGSIRVRVGLGTGTLGRGLFYIITRVTELFDSRLGVGISALRYLMSIIIGGYIL